MPSRNAGSASWIPTGYYTEGLLLQVFTRPERTTRIPETVKQRLAALGLRTRSAWSWFSRKEMPLELAQRYYRLYGLDYQLDNPLHSAPV